MKQLFCFAFAEPEVIAAVEHEHNGEMNLLYYWTNRKLAFAERAMIESYILTDFAIHKTDFYKSETSSFTYLGIDSSLEKYLDPMKNIRADDAKINAAIKNLLDLVNAGSILPIKLER